MLLQHRCKVNYLLHCLLAKCSGIVDGDEEYGPWSVHYFIAHSIAVSVYEREVNRCIFRCPSNKVGFCIYICPGAVGKIVYGKGLLHPVLFIYECGFIFPLLVLLLCGNEVCAGLVHPKVYLRDVAQGVSLQGNYEHPVCHKVSPFNFWGCNGVEFLPLQVNHKCGPKQEEVLYECSLVAQVYCLPKTSAVAYRIEDEYY